jgi:hypothetical protein
MHHVIRRPRATALVTPPTTQPHTPSTVRAPNLRVTSERAGRLAADRQAIMDDLKLISESDDAIDRAQAAKEAAIARIEERMRDHRLPTVDNGKLIAELSEHFTRQGITIDPRKFKAKVTNDQFWGSIKVSVTEARQLLGEKELLGISDVVPATSLGFSVKIRELKKK